MSTMTIAPLNAVAGPRGSRMPRTVIVFVTPRTLSVSCAFSARPYEAGRTTESGVKRLR
jgi:hypothetical protein